MILASGLVKSRNTSPTPTRIFSTPPPSSKGDPPKTADDLSNFHALPLGACPSVKNSSLRLLLKVVSNQMRGSFGLVDQPKPSESVTYDFKEL